MDSCYPKFVLFSYHKQIEKKNNFEKFQNSHAWIQYEIEWIRKYIFVRNTRGDFGGRGEKQSQICLFSFYKQCIQREAMSPLPIWPPRATLSFHNGSPLTKQAPKQLVC